MARSALINALESNGLPTIRVPNVQGFECNCWGFVAYYLGWIDKVQWMYHGDMEGLLEKNAIEVADPQPGDIVVYRDYKLEHTAILLADNQVAHKPGAMPLEVGDINERYGYANKITYMRNRPAVSTPA